MTCRAADMLPVQRAVPRIEAASTAAQRALGPSTGGLESAPSKVLVCDRDGDPPPHSRAGLLLPLISRLNGETPPVCTALSPGSAPTEGSDPWTKHGAPDPRYICGSPEDSFKNTTYKHFTKQRFPRQQCFSTPITNNNTNKHDSTFLFPH